MVRQQLQVWEWGKGNLKERPGFLLLLSPALPEVVRAARPQRASCSRYQSSPEELMAARAAHLLPQGSAIGKDASVQQPVLSLQQSADPGNSKPLLRDDSRINV